MAHAFFLGIDVADDTSDTPGAVTATLLEKSDDATDAPQYRLDSIAHYDASPDADDLADRFQSLVADSPYTGRTTLVVHTGPSFGQSLFDALEDRGLAPVSVTLTGGRSAAPAGTDDMGVHLAEFDAIDRLTRAYRDGRLDLEGPSSEHVSQLARGIQSFVAAATDEEDATETPDALDAEPQRPEAFDTHVTSAALALWTGAERSFDPTEHLKDTPRTEVSPPMA